MKAAQTVVDQYEKEGAGVGDGFVLNVMTMWGCPGFPVQFC